MTTSDAERWTVWCLTLGLLAGLSACADTKPQAGDSESHFLTRCAADCPGDLACICGVCSAACEQDAQCTVRAPDATCETLAGLACGSEAPPAACQVACTTDGQCAGLGPDHRCELGRCVAPGTPVVDSDAATPAPDAATAASDASPPDAGPAPPAECNWPEYLNDDERPPGACKPGRHMLTCAQGDGFSICVTDAASCDPRVAEDACEEGCEPGEYAITCGGVGPGRGEPDPPANCHDPLYTPGGVFYMCCPCGG